MPYPVPNATDTRDLYNFFKFVNNDASGGLFFPVILLVVWVIAFVGSIAEGRPPSRALIFASFIGSLLGALLVLMGFLQAQYVYFLILLMAGGVLWNKLASARE